MLKPVLLAALSVLFCVVSASPALAGSSDNEVSIGVLAVNFMAWPTETELCLEPSPTDPAARLIGAADQSGALVMSHNGADGLQITVTAAADLMNPTNDISLVLAIADLAPQLCVDHGMPVADVALAATLPPGGGLTDLLWTAEASAEGTAAGSYSWTIMITSTDL